MKDKILQGDVREVLKELEDESVHCVVTSPPYWGLRDYGTAEWVGGSEECDHSYFKGGNGEASKKQVTNNGTQKYQYTGQCPKCGALRQDKQLGLEPTPQEHIEEMVKIFREIKRVLRKDGTLWMNYGDTYNAMQGSGWTTGSGGDFRGADGSEKRKLSSGLKPKDLVGMPWRLALALQEDGWYLRSDIIWHKPNPMPESVRDRPTKAHEYLFLLTKSSKYYYDQEAIKENSTGQNGKAATFYRESGCREARNPYGNNSGSEDKYVPREDVGSRNKRTVWTIPTAPYKEAHFAVFPPKLVEPCIKAGCPKGGIVLDPFFGSGTVGQVAIKNERHYVGIELNEEYIKLAKKRINSLTREEAVLDEFGNVQTTMFGDLK